MKVRITYALPKSILFLLTVEQDGPLQYENETNEDALLSVLLPGTKVPARRFRN
jgi:hypothetical protein